MTRPASTAPAENSVRAKERVASGAALPLCVFFILLLLLTRPTYIGDTVWYALDINRALGGDWAHSRQIWNFAHLLLRPLGIVLSWLFAGPASLVFGGDRQAGITLLLASLSAAAAFGCALLVHRMTLSLTRNNAAGIAAAAGFLSLSVVLNYSRSGASYLPGLACSLAALYWAGFSPRRSRRRAVLSGVLAALSVLFWLPYIVFFPAILLARPILNPGKENARGHLAFGAAFAIGAAATLLAVYGAAAIAVKATAWSELAAWIRGSDTQYRDRKALRMVTGFARSFYEMGNEAVWLKWFLFKDPYAHVGLLELLRASFLRLALCYASVAGLAVLLWRAAGGRRLLLLAAVAAAPQIGMALMLESGSPERYLAALPLLFVGFGFAIANPAFSARTRAAAAALCCLHAPFNLVALSAPAVNRQVEAASSRLAAVAPAGPAATAYVVNNMDGAWILRQSHPFHPMNRKALPELAAIVSPGPRAPLWRSDFACAALATWRRGGEVWVAKRVLHETPERSWLWVEGDDPRLSWTQIHQFFVRVERAGEDGGADGFFRVSSEAAARREMLASAPGGDAANCPKPPAARE
jgi:hypothetical protein